MYSVSADYSLKMLDQIQTHRLVGVLDGNVNFTDSDVIGVSYTNKCSDKKIALGSVNIGVLKLTFLNDPLNRGDYYGKTITISDGLLTDPLNNVFEDIPIGTFYIAEAVWTAEGMVDIVAYDCLSKMDEDLTIDQTSGTVYSFCKYIETETGAVFGMTEEECQALPNGLEVISPYEENSLTTWRDLVSAIGSFIGGFAYADRNGTWKLKSFGNTNVITIPKNRRISGSKFSDFTTLFDGVKYTDIQSEIEYFIGDGNGQIMNLGAHPFLQYGTSHAKERRATAILDVVKKMVYTPYNVSLLPAFIALDLADVISFVDDYTSDTSSGAIMTITYTYNKSFKIQCFGENPNLRTTQSQNDKNIIGISKDTTRNEVTYYNYANVEALNFGAEQETTIASLAFTSAQETTVKILHEFMMDFVSDMSQDCSYELHYYLDDELIAYKPGERVGGLQGATTGSTETTICRDFFYILKDVAPNERHKWEVKMIAHGVDSVEIDVNHAHVTLEGQRLYAEDFKGNYIEAEDFITIIPFGYLGLVSITDSVNISTTDPDQWIHPQVGDSVEQYSYTTLGILPITEGTGLSAPTITMERGFPWALEDGALWETEDGKIWYTD